MPKARDPIERLLSLIEINPTTGCWEWTRKPHKKGYAVVRMGSRTDGTRRLIQAHIESYRLLVGPIPEGLELDHLCRVKHCINPEHLEPVTHLENVRRGAAAVIGKPTHCPQGHEYTEADTYVDYKGIKHCKICRRASHRRMDQRKRDSKCGV